MEDFHLLYGIFIGILFPLIVLILSKLIKIKVLCELKRDYIHNVIYKKTGSKLIKGVGIEDFDNFVEFKNHYEITYLGDKTLILQK